MTDDQKATLAATDDPWKRELLRRLFEKAANVTVDRYRWLGEPVRRVKK